MFQSKGPDVTGYLFSIFSFPRKVQALCKLSLNKLCKQIVAAAVDLYLEGASFFVCIYEKKKLSK